VLWIVRGDLEADAPPPIFGVTHPITSDTNNPAALALRANQSEAGRG
jgi:hypothetical protein